MSAVPNTPAAATALPVFANRAAALAAARALLPRIRARAARTEADRRIPDETIQEIIDAGLTGIVTPRIFGGSRPEDKRVLVRRRDQAPTTNALIGR